MELVTIDEWQRSLKPLTTEQRAKVTKKTVVKPGERYGMIKRVADERRFDQDPYLQKFQLKIHSNEMIHIPARVLTPPDIKYKSKEKDDRDVIERVQVGKWYLNNHLVKPKEIKTWALVLVSQKEPDSRQVGLARDFAGKIPQVFIRKKSLF